MAEKKWERAIQEYDINNKELYGYIWGDPNAEQAYEDNKKIIGNYLKIKEEYLLPYIHNYTTILELGCLGGKWTQYFLNAKKIICVDITEKSFEYIKHKLNTDNIDFYLTKGNELKGVEDNSVDIIFSIDSLVRVEKKNIKAYFKEFSRILKVHGKILVHLPCSDIKGSVERHFVNLKKEEIVNLCQQNGFNNFEIDVNTINHGVLLKVNYYEKY